jgi:hypothetical protein
MASTYSTNLAIELIATGEQAGTWGNTTNTNLGTLIEQAISGYVTQAITDGADTVITIPNGATGVARNMHIECTGTLTANRNLIVPANKKHYYIYNNTTGGYSVTVKVSGQTGVAVPAGTKFSLMCNGTDVVLASFAIPQQWTTAGRPGSPYVGLMGYNTTTNEFEGYSGSSPAWKSIGGSALSNDTSTASDYYPTFATATSGTATNLYTSNAKLLYKPSTGELKVSAPVATNGIVVNATTVGANYTIASGQNGFSVGPVTVSSGITVTVTSGQRWVVI